MFVAPALRSVDICSSVASADNTRETLASNTSPTIVTRPVEPTLVNRTSAAAAHALRDYLGQGLGRLSSVGIFCAVAMLDEFSLRIAAGVAGSLIGGNLARRLAAAQIGTETGYQKAGVAFCTVLGAAAGGTISSLGSNQLVISIAACTLLTAGASVVRRNADDSIAQERVEGDKVSSATLGLMGGLVAGSIDPVWKVDSHLLPARNLGLIAESTLIEIVKSSFERVGPSVDRQALNFEGRVVAALTGMVPYVAATVLLNGYIAGKLQPGYDSTRFDELIGPALVGAIANAVRGATNALAISLLQSQQRFTATDGRACLRSGNGAQCPKLRTVSDKACVRYFLSACRNAVYARLRDAHFSVTDASMIAQGVYACFAQCRDLIADLINGDGWSAPRLQARPVLPDPSAATDNTADADAESVIV